MGERGEAVEEAGRRYREADARLLGQKAGDSRGVAGILLVAERDDPDAGSLRHAAEVRDRDAGHAIDRVEAVELERIDDEMKAIRQLLLWFRSRARVFFFHCCFSHGGPPSYPVVERFSPNSRHSAPHDRRGRAHGRVPALPRDRSHALPELR